MSGLNSNISALFNSLGGGNSGSGTTGSIDLANYAAIKNGSFGKLAKAYYGEGPKVSDAPKATTTNMAKNAEKVSAVKKSADTTGLAQMKKDADELKTSAEALGSADL